MKNLYCILCFLLIVTFQNGFAVATDKNSPLFSPAQVKEIQQITYKHLIQNPQILVEVSNELRKRDAIKKKEKEKEKTKEIEANIVKYKKEIFGVKNPGRVVFGNPDGKIILVKFTQHQCPSCKDSALMLHQLIKDKPEIKLIVIYWPFLGKDAVHSAKAVFAAQKQNKAAELNHALFSHQGRVTKDNIDPIIKSIKGLNSKQLATDMDNKKFDKGLKNNFKLAQDLGLTGTPAFIFTNKEMTKFSFIPAATPDLSQDIDKAIKEVS